MEPCLLLFLVLYGVPQGTVLGPIPFILYTDPISVIVNTHSLSHHSFSYDNQFYVTRPASELSNSVTHLSIEILDECK